ncbi:MAG TPA: hypothetical protein VG986_11925 [Pseudolabrys sp.]|nr:hypothetical protein [Pseudolabrys sp.]
MRKWFTQIVGEITQDDLFVRLMQLLAGLDFGALGILIFLAARHEPLTSESRILAGVSAAFLLVAALFLVCCCAPSKSRLGRFGKKFVPDAAGLEDAIVLVVLIALPAALLTLLLRRVGFGRKA